MIATLFAPTLWRAFFVLLLAAVCYLSLKPNPQISEVGFMPTTAAEFFDLYDNWKNVTGFGAMALAGFLGWPDGWGKRKWSALTRERVQLWSLFSVIIVMESCQLLIATRWADGKDVAAGGLGVVIAWCVSAALRHAKGEAVRAKGKGSELRGKS